MVLKTKSDRLVRPVRVTVSIQSDHLNRPGIESTLNRTNQQVFPKPNDSQFLFFIFYASKRHRFNMHINHF